MLRVFFSKLFNRLRQTDGSTTPFMGIYKNIKNVSAKRVEHDFAAWWAMNWPMVSSNFLTLMTWHDVGNKQAQQMCRLTSDCPALLHQSGIDCFSSVSLAVRSGELDSIRFLNIICPCYVPDNSFHTLLAKLSSLTHSLSQSLTRSLALSLGS